MRIDYEKYYYCSLCRKKYEKNSEELKTASNGAFLCPDDKQRLRTKARFK